MGQVWARRQPRRRCAPAGKAGDGARREIAVFYALRFTPSPGVDRGTRIDSENIVCHLPRVSSSRRPGLDASGLRGSPPSEQS